MSAQLRVLVVDDSALMRRLITDLLESDPGVKVAGTARDGLEALQQIDALHPDVVTLDVRMPRMSGLEALERIMREMPLPIVMLSGLDEPEVAFEALELGAVDFVLKPSGTISVDLYKIRDELLEKVKVAVLANASKLARRASLSTPEAGLVSAPLPLSLPLVDSDLRWALTVAASTGGPRTLEKFLQALPSDLPAAVLVVSLAAVGCGREPAASQPAGNKPPAGGPDLPEPPQGDLVTVKACIEPGSDSPDSPATLVIELAPGGTGGLHWNLDAPPPEMELMPPEGMRLERTKVVLSADDALHQRQGAPARAGLAGRGGFHQVAHLVAQQRHRPVVEGGSHDAAQGAVRLAPRPDVLQLEHPVVGVDVVSAMLALADRHHPLHVAVTVEGGAAEGRLHHLAVAGQERLGGGEEGLEVEVGNAPSSHQQGHEVDVGCVPLEKPRAIAPEGREHLLEAILPQDQGIEQQSADGGLPGPRPLGAPPAPEEGLHVQHGETVAQAVSRPAPVAPVVDELLGVGVAVDSHGDGFPAGAAGGHRAKPASPAAPPQLPPLALDLLPGQGRQFLQVVHRAEVGRRQPQGAEEVPVVGDVLGCVLHHPPEEIVLPGA